MKPWEESPEATGPISPGYDPRPEQRGNLIAKVGLELYLWLEKTIEEVEEPTDIIDEG